MQPWPPAQPPPGAGLPAQRASKASRARLGIAAIALCAVLAVSNSMALVYVGPKVWLRCQLKTLLHELGDTQFEVSGGHTALVQQCLKRAGNTMGHGQDSGLNKVLGLWNRNNQRPTRYRIVAANGSLPHHIPPISSCRYCYTCYIHQRANASQGNDSGSAAAVVTIDTSRRQMLGIGEGCRSGSGAACWAPGAVPIELADSSADEMDYVHRRLNHGGPLHVPLAVHISGAPAAGDLHRRRIAQKDDDDDGGDEDELSPGEEDDPQPNVRLAAGDDDEALGKQQEERVEEWSGEENRQRDELPERTQSSLPSGAEPTRKGANAATQQGVGKGAEDGARKGTAKETSKTAPKAPASQATLPRPPPLQAGLAKKVEATFAAAVPAKKKLMPDPRAHLPNCSECSACTHQLESLAGKVESWGLRYLLPGAGASRAWIFKASTEKGEGGAATAKVWCLPIDKTGNGIPACELVSMDNYVTKLKALDRLIDDCGFRELFSRVWVERVRGIIPNFGYAVDSDGLFMNIASGVPLHQMTFGTPKHRMQDIIDVFKKVNSTLIIKAAIFDLLTSQCDRHAENVFIDESLRLTLIDNDMMLGESWRKCGVDSIFLPTTQKYEINVHGYYYVMRSRYKGSKPKGMPNPQLLFDYRCHAKNGTLGRDYPPSVTKCLTRMRDSSLEEIVKLYGFTLRQTSLLKARAESLLGRGFEWTLQHGHPQNPDLLRYPLQPSCCDVTFIGDATGKRDDFRCSHSWKPLLADGKELPWLKPPSAEALKAKRKKAGRR